MKKPLHNTCTTYTMKPVRVTFLYAAKLKDIGVNGESGGNNSKFITFYSEISCIETSLYLKRKNSRKLYQ